MNRPSLAPVSVERGIGCASVIPAAVMGVFILDDQPPPTGWLGASEFLGWAVLCWGAGIGIGVLLRQIRQTDARRFLAVPLALIAAGLFNYLPYWNAPTLVKVGLPAALQVIGSITPIALVISGVIVGVRQRY